MARWRSAALGTLLILGAACSSAAAPTAHPPAAAPSTAAARSTTTAPPSQPVIIITPRIQPAAKAKTPPTTRPPRPLQGRTITIDAGHNGGNASHAAQISRPIWIGTQYRACDTTGTQGNDGYPEYAYNLDVALRLRNLLAAAGANVVMVRTTSSGWGPCIDERAYIGNRAHSAAAISIHADGGPSGGRGFHVNMPANIKGYTDDIYGSSHRLGVDVRNALVGAGMQPSTYVGSSGLLERRDFGGLNLSDVPKVLVEMGNMRNASDLARLEDPVFRQRQAQALAKAIMAFVAGH